MCKLSPFASGIIDGAKAISTVKAVLTVMTFVLILAAIGGVAIQVNASAAGSSATSSSSTSPIPNNNGWQ